MNDFDERLKVYPDKIQQMNNQLPVVRIPMERYAGTPENGIDKLAVERYQFRVQKLPKSEIQTVDPSEYEILPEGDHIVLEWHISETYTSQPGNWHGCLWFFNGVQRFSSDLFNWKILKSLKTND